MKHASLGSAAAAIVLATALLTGCSAVNAIANVQTKVAACSKIKDSFTAVGTTMNAESAKLASDPKSAATKISAAAKKFSTDADSLSNAQVKKAAQTAAKSFTKLAADISTISSKPTAASEAKLQADLAPLETSFAAVGKTCKL